VPETACFSGSAADRTIALPDYLAAAQADPQENVPANCAALFMSETGHLFYAKRTD
jgi:hypothetical protein